MKLLNALVKYAGIISLLVLLIQSFVNNRPRLTVDLSKIEKYRSCIEEADEHYNTVYAPTNALTVLSINFSLTNRGKWPCCIESWKLKIGKECFSNFDCWPNNFIIEPCLNLFEPNNVYVPLPDIDPYLQRFQSVKTAVAFEIPTEKIKSNKGVLTIKYSTFRPLINRSLTAKQKFTIPGLL